MVTCNSYSSKPEAAAQFPVKEYLAHSLTIQNVVSGFFFFFLMNVKNFIWVFLGGGWVSNPQYFFHVTKKMNMHPKIWQYMLPMEANEI